MDEQPTLRDIFAMFALIGLIPSVDATENEFAAASYKMADAMMEERSKSSEDSIHGNIQKGRIMFEAKFHDAEGIVCATEEISPKFQPKIEIFNYDSLYSDASETTRREFLSEFVAACNDQEKRVYVYTSHPEVEEVYVFLQETANGKNPKPLNFRMMLPTMKHHFNRATIHEARNLEKPVPKASEMIEDLHISLTEAIDEFNRLQNKVSNLEESLHRVRKACHDRFAI